MVLRMFEYGLRGAMQHDKKYDKGRLTITFPSPAVIYLRGNPPDVLEMEIVFPHINKTVSYPVPTISLSVYTLEELANKKLLPLLMFYPMKYEDIPKNVDNLEQIRDTFITEVKSLPDILNKLYNTGELTNTQVDTIVNVFSRIASQTISKTSIIPLKGDETAMSEAAKLETIRVRNFYAELEESKLKAEKKGVKKGEKKGELVGIVKILNVLKERGQSSEQLKSVAKAAGLSEAEYKKIIRKINKDKQKTLPKDKPIQ